MKPGENGGVEQASVSSRGPSSLSVDTPRVVSLVDVQRAAGLGTRRPIVTVVTGPNAGEIFSLIGKDEFVLGRASDADIWVEDVGVSRKQARLRRTANGFVIEDLGSTNGTFVDDRPIPQGTEVAVVPGTHIRCGNNLVLRFAEVDIEEEQLLTRLFENSIRDPLTHAYNRKYLNERLTAEVAHSRRHSTPLAVLMLDLDSFKVVNDRFGHLVGDDVLQAVAQRIERLTRVEDVFARYGGEEFVLLVRGAPHDAATALAQRVRKVVGEIAVHTGETVVGVTASIGVASLSEMAEDAPASTLLAKADERLLNAKQSGRNRVCSSDD